MAKRRPALTGDLKQISECWLYRDPRVSRRARLHTFCRECKESSTINQDSCPLCRPFLRIPDDGSGSFPTNYVKEKLVDLHQEYLEKKLNLKDEKIIDIPLIEQLNLSEVGNPFPRVAWLENKIYVLYSRSTTIRVFTDQAPFDELLLEAIQIPGLGEIMSMTASTVCRSIFISDIEFRYIYKIQLSNGNIYRWKILPLDGKSGYTTRMSNSIVSVDCLVTSFVYRSPDGSIQNELQLFSQFDSGLRRYPAIPLPKEMKYIGHVVHSPDHNFVISYSKTFPVTQCWICILSSDGKKIIRTFDPKIGSVLKNPGVFVFDIDADGRIFVSDVDGDRVICLNSNFTEYRILMQKNREIEYPCDVVYIPEKRQLLVSGKNRVGPNEFKYCISVFHLSPCNLDQQRQKQRDEK